MPSKALPARVKAADTAADTPGSFRALVAAYNTDSGGDRIVPGAFTKSLDKWEASGKTIPVVWAHQHTDAFAYIGDVLDAKETDDGLEISGQLDIDNNPTAKQVYRLIKGGRINNYSFAYEVIDSESSKSDDGDGATTLLKELEIFEAGPCLVGMNRDTRTIDVKHRDPQGKDDVPRKAVPGSFEARQDALLSALTNSISGSGDVWAWPVATFSDHVVYCITGGGNEGTYSAPYSVNADGVITIGDATPVEIEEMVVAAPPKDGHVETNTTTPQAKAGRALSAANLTALQEALQSIQNGVEKIESVTGVTDDDDATENGKAQSGEPAKSDDDPRDNAPADDPNGKSDDAHAHDPAEDVLSQQFELEQMQLATY